MRTPLRRSLRLRFSSLVASVICAFASLASGQSAPIWNGSVRCDIDLKGPGYSSHETHTWTLTGDLPPDGSQDYPATWTVSGSGSRTPTGTLRSAATWATQGSAPGVRMAIFVRQSDQRLLVFTRHGQLSTANGTTGTEEAEELGRRARPQPISKSASEWRPFPAIQDTATSTHVTGSSTTPLTRLDASQPIGTSGQAVCTWDLAQGAATGGRKTSQLSGTVPRAGGALPWPPRTITLPGFTAAGSFAPVAARTIALPGFTAAGEFTPIPPRTITLTGWTAAGP
jgi:hypothetical protein